MASKLNLDKLDLQIIQAMTEDAGISYADLGKQFFVSGGTIHVRIKKLNEAGIDIKRLFGTGNLVRTPGETGEYQYTHFSEAIN